MSGSAPGRSSRKLADLALDPELLTAVTHGNNRISTGQGTTSRLARDSLSEPNPAQEKKAPTGIEPV
jgi:hypothetical protein